MRCARRHSPHSKDQCPLFTPQADIARQHSHVRFGSKADIRIAKSHVRFALESGHVKCTNIAEKMIEAAWGLGGL